MKVKMKSNMMYKNLSQHLFELILNFQPRGLKVVKRSQLVRHSVCEISDCAGLCLPTTDENIPFCYCSNGTKTTSDCSTNSKGNIDGIALFYTYLIKTTRCNTSCTSPNSFHWRISGKPIRALKLTRGSSFLITWPHRYFITHLVK